MKNKAGMDSKENCQWWENIGCVINCKSIVTHQKFNFINLQKTFMFISMQNINFIDIQKSSCHQICKHET